MGHSCSRWTRGRVSNLGWYIQVFYYSIQLKTEKMAAKKSYKRARKQLALKLKDIQPRLVLLTAGKNRLASASSLGNLSQSSKPLYHLRLLTQSFQTTTSMWMTKLFLDNKRLRETRATAIKGWTPKNRSVLDYLHLKQRQCWGITCLIRNSSPPILRL